MEGKKMGKGLTDGMQILRTLVVGLGAVILSAVIVLITVGVVTDTVADGNIPLSGNATTGMTGAVVDLETTATTNVTTALSNLPLIFGILALVIVLAVIGWLVFGRNSKGADY